MQDYIWFHGKKNVFRGMIKTFLMLKEDKKEYLKVYESIKTKINDGTRSPRTKSLLHKTHVEEMRRLGELQQTAERKYLANNKEFEAVLKLPECDSALAGCTGVKDTIFANCGCLIYCNACAVTVGFLVAKNTCPQCGGDITANRLITRIAWA